MDGPVTLLPLDVQKSYPYKLGSKNHKFIMSLVFVSTVVFTFYNDVTETS